MTRSAARNILLMTVALLAVIATLFLLLQPEPPSTHGSLTTVVFGVLPYLDHTYAVVGEELGWFEELGIDLQLRQVGVEHIVPWLKNRTVDVCSTPPGILMSSWDSAPDLVHFVFGNLFTGYAIMAQPDKRYRSYTHFRREGLTPEVAARRAIGQLKDKRFAYPPEDAIRPFIDLSLSRAGLSLKDVDTVVMDDPLTVNAMRNNTVDFQTGGAPSRVTLQAEGYLPIFTSVDLLEFAEASPASPELAGILQSGWATTRAFYESQHDVVLRLAAVNYRIMEALQDPEGKAREIHLAYLASLTGDDSFSAEQVAAFYNDLNLFRTFEQQAEWFSDTTSPRYYSHLNGAILRSWTSRPGYFRRKPPTVEDVIFDDDVYKELAEIRRTVTNLERRIEEARAVGRVELSQEQEDTLKAAQEESRAWNIFSAKDRLATLASELDLYGR